MMSDRRLHDGLSHATAVAETGLGVTGLGETGLGETGLAGPGVAGPGLGLPMLLDAPQLADEVVSEAELQLLAQVAISAAARGLGPVAAPLFDAIEVLAPHHACGSVCRALTALGRNQVDVAIAELRQRGARARVGAGEARALLMLALCLARRKAEALALYADLAHGPDGPARRLAAKLYAAFLRTA